VPRDGIVLVDVGVHHNWMVQQWPVYQPQTGSAGLPMPS